VKGETNIVLTLRNTLNRNMTAEEEKGFIDEFLQFISDGLSLEMDGVSVLNVEVWYQQQVDWTERRGRKRKLQESQLATTALTLILQVRYFESSDEEVGDTIVTFIEKAEVSIINLFRGNEEYEFFYTIDALKARSIEQVTFAPVVAPSSVVGEISSKQSANAQDETSGGSTGGMFSLYFECHNTCSDASSSQFVTDTPFILILSKPMPALVLVQWHSVWL
jgi:uncharacterized protein YggL (DUF469 family)